MKLRLRQVALVVEDLAAAVADMQAIFGAIHSNPDPAVARYGLENAVFALGGSFVEILAPVAAGTTAGRLLAKRGGDSGYMVILQTDQQEAARKRAQAMDIRIAEQHDQGAISFTHLHPKDIGGTLLSIDAMPEWESWEWGGPDWQRHSSESGCKVVAAEMQGADPEWMAQRWGQLLDRTVMRESDHWAIALDEGTLRFTGNTDGRGEGLSGLDIRAIQGQAIRTAARDRGRLGDDGRIALCGVAVRLVEPA